ncbi:MAG: NAD-dependent protein deacetylase [Gammaproteobacteria bacterium]|nr:NAD-dependent protein deacetylase [Gammaproteobacteria bacterium]
MTDRQNDNRAVLAQLTDSATSDLALFVQEHQPLFVLTGAGCSTLSGLADYRDAAGKWKRQQPITGQVFINDERARQRYWARSALGWPAFDAAVPNAAHQMLTQLQTRGFERQLVTQNVDGLHQRAGHQGVIELHGHLARVTCLGCGRAQSRTDYQHQLLAINPDLSHQHATAAPDGDADLEDDTFVVNVPPCTCGGLMKPDVVFFGENVPRERVQQATAALAHSRGMLVVGSSLMVYSGYRFCKQAAELNIPIASINQGVTRADSLLTLNVQADCADALTGLLSRL